MAECEKMMQLCEESLDRTLTAEEQEQLDRHLQSCPACAAWLADLRYMTAALAEEPAFPEGLHAAIVSGIAEESRRTVVQTHRPPRWAPVFTMLAAAAACVMLVLSGALGDLMSAFDFGLSGGGASGSSAGGAMNGAAPAEASEDAPEVEGAAFDSYKATSDAGEAADTAPNPGRVRTAAAPESKQEGPAEAAGDAVPYTMDGGNAPAGVPSGAGRAAEPPAEMQPQVGAFIAGVMEGEVFAGCFLVEGGENLPEIGKEQQRDEHFGYYVADNNPAQLETLLDALEKAGCTVQTYAESGILFNEEARQVIFVVRVA